MEASGQVMKLPSRATRKSTIRGIAVDSHRIEDGIEALKRQIWQTAQRIPWRNDTTGVRVKKTVPITSTNKLLEECRKNRIDPPPTTNAKEPAFQEWWTKWGERADFIAAVQEYRSLNKTLELLKTLQRRTKPNGKLDAGLKYYGAHTGRWSGTGGINLQNLPRSPIAGVDIRGMLVPEW